MRNRLTIKNHITGGSEGSHRSEMTMTSSTGPWIRIFDMARLCLNYKRLIVGLTVATFAVTTAVMILTPNKYQSTATILPSGSSDKMADLKSLAGIGSIGGTDENSSELFPSILKSHTVSDALIAKEFTFTHGDRVLTMLLADYLDEGNPDDLRSALLKATSVKLDKKSGVITLGVTTEYPALSQQVATAYLKELEDFNLHKRKSVAGEKATYLAGQIDQKKEDLKKTETALEQFQMVNRDWAGSSDPEIVLTIGRMRRDLEIMSTTYAFLVQEYEAAKLDAQKDVPIVRILDQPGLPATKVSPLRIMTIAVATSMAFIMSLIAVAMVGLFQHIKNGPEKNSYEMLRTELTEEFPRISGLIKTTSRQTAAVGSADEP